MLLVAQPAEVLDLDFGRIAGAHLAVLPAQVRAGLGQHGRHKLVHRRGGGLVAIKDYWVGLGSEQ
jgi:hypothetical protein